MPVFDVYDSNTPRRIETNSKRITIGRTAENHVPVDEGQASRCHCEIRLTDIGYILRDLKSRNGTHLNQDPIDRPMPLRDGDEIGVGKATIRFWSTLAKSKNSGVELPLISHAKSANQKTDSGTAIGRTDKRPRTAARPSAKAPKVAPAPHSDKGRKKADNHDTDTKIRLVEAPQPSPAGGDHAAGGPIESAHSGPLNIGHIIPLNAEGKPAHPVGDDGAELSAPMICLKKIFLQGLNFTATDIHMEPKEHQLHLRYRIDGCLHHCGTIDPKVAKSVYSIIKLLCNLDISKKNIMQDGSFAVQLPDRRIDIRVSIAPSTRGDKMVLRILDKNLAPQGLDSLGMEDYMLGQVRERAFKGSNMLIVCGPTGSGKTTTVYAMLREINAQDRNIVTVEDPVEYKLDNITQIQVNPKFNITFRAALTSLLRQDPDVILIGEIRDAETARMALQSAMTGHLVFSTLHARDSIGSLFRLLDLGVEPFLLSSALTAVLSQRLIRRLCPRCKMKIKPAVRDLAQLGLEDCAGTDLYSPVGCDDCLGIGYRGRAAVFEMLAINDQVRDAIVTRPTIQQLRIAAGDWIFQTIRQDAIRKLRSGHTSLAEVGSIIDRE